MAINTSDFILAGTAIAIGGVGLYLWDTRGKKALGMGTQQNYQPLPSTGQPYSGGKSKRTKKYGSKKTRRQM
jgi:hypothetical protein